MAGLRLTTVEIPELTLKQAITGEIALNEERGYRPLDGSKLADLVLVKYLDDWHTRRYREMLELVADGVLANPWCGPLGMFTPELVA